MKTPSAYPKQGFFDCNSSGYSYFGMLCCKAYENDFINDLKNTVDFQKYIKMPFYEIE